MEIFNIKKSDVCKNYSFVPEYYYFNRILKDKYVLHGGNYISLGDVASISDGEHSAIPRRDDAGVRYLYGRNIREGVIDFDPISDSSYITPEDYAKYPRCHIKENDVLIAIYGTVGKSAVYKKAYVNTAGIPRHIANITLNGNAPFSPEFLTAYFRSKYGKAQIKSFLTGNIQQLFSLKSLRQFQVPLLPNGIRDQITEIEKQALSYLIISQKLIEKAKHIFLSGLGFDTNSITRDLCFNVKADKLLKSNVWSVSLYDSFYNKVEKTLKEHLPCLELGELVYLTHGIEVGSAAYVSYENRSLDDIPFIRTSDIVNHEADLYPDNYVSPVIGNEFLGLTKPGDILFTKDGKIASVGMVENVDRIIPSSGIEILRLKPSAVESGFTPEYLFISLACPEVGELGAKKRTVYASTIPHLRPENLSKIVIPQMPQPYIEEITNLVAKAFSLKSMRKNILKQSENIIDDYFFN